LEFPYSTGWRTGSALGVCEKVYRFAPFFARRAAPDTGATPPAACRLWQQPTADGCPLRRPEPGLVPGGGPRTCPPVV